MNARCMAGIARRPRPTRLWPQVDHMAAEIDDTVEIAEARRAANDTVVDCVVCGQPMRHDGLLCDDCAA